MNPPNSSCTTVAQAHPCISLRQKKQARTTTSNQNEAGKAKCRAEECTSCAVEAKRTSGGIDVHARRARAAPQATIRGAVLPTQTQTTECRTKQVRVLTGTTRRTECLT